MRHRTNSTLIVSCAVFVGLVVPACGRSEMGWDDLDPSELGQGGTHPDGGDGGSGGTSTGGTGGDTGGFGGSTGGFGGSTGGAGGAEAGVCLGGPDDDCDSDGWRVADGDCCDRVGWCSTTPELVNPGAFEYIGNGVDDDCDGLVDNLKPPCDGLLNNSGSSDPIDYAKAMDLCQTTTEDAPLPSRRWGVISGKFTLTNGTGIPSSQARAIRSMFGDLITPIHGGRVAVLSTGHAASVGQTNPDYAMFQSGVDLGLTSPFPPDWYQANGGKLPNAPGCPSPSGNVAFDPIMLTLRIRVPTNARSFSFASWFFSAEFPEYVCTQFNDFFVVLVDTPPPQWPNPADKNLAVYRVTNPPKLFPIGVNLAADPDAQNLFSVCKAGPTGCNGSPKPGNAPCLSGPTYLQGTGFDDTSQPGCGSSNLLGGGTGWLTTVGNVAPGATMEIRIALWDTSDGVWDSLVVLDNWVWNVYPASPGTW